MTAVAVLPEQAYTIPPHSPRAKAESLVRQMETALQRKLPRFKDIEAFVTPYSTNVEPSARRYETDALNVLDETIFFARTTLASGLYWGMTNPSREWRQWTITDPDLAESGAVKDWLHLVNQRAMTVLSRSNFYDAMAWCYDEWPAFATAVILIEEDERDVVRYVPFAIGSYALADDANGEPVAVSRRFTMTVRQVIERFATDRVTKRVNLSLLSPAVQGHARAGKMEETVEIVHLICPNDHADARKGTPDRMPFASYYWEAGTDQSVGTGGFLAHEGYHEWPLMVFRWKRIPGDPWGTDSPGILTLGVNKSLQAMESDLLMAVEKQVKPPIMVPPELVTASLLPAAKNAVRPAQHMQIGALHETDPRSIQLTSEVQDKARERLMALWFTRLMLAFTSDPRNERPTAREVEEVSQEKYLVLGRVLEAAGKTFERASDREFAVMLRRGLVPEPPPELEGMPLRVEYTSILAIAQRAVGLGSLERFGMGMAEMGKVITDPGFQAKVDWAQYVDEVAQRSGIPPRVVRSDEDVAKIQAAQAAAVQEQARVEQAALEARAAKDASQASMEGDTALTRIVNSGLRPDQVGV